jgi:ligand-binding SRPBCC domain-containing protein
MPSIFHTQTKLAASAETMFAFHSDPNNLSVVMPPTLRLVSMKTDGMAEEGRLIELHCRDFGIIPMHWICRWKTVRAPSLLEDEIIQGPFPLFVHQHRFEPLGTDQCIMHDKITYQWGRSWWGRVISETGVRVYLFFLFQYRHHRTRQWAYASQKS